MFDINPFTTENTLDCGASCLKMFLEYYGIEPEYMNLMRQCNIRLYGCTMKDIKRVGNSYGLNMKAYKMSADELIRQDRPAIIWWKYNHFVVFCGIDGDKVVIANPDKGRYGIPKKSFISFYTGCAIFNGEPMDMTPQPTE